MSYSKFLEKSIHDSGFSLRSIANQCKSKYNVTITPSYLSKLQTGAQTPASKEVNSAVAKVCKINPEDLQFEADFERAPESVKFIINQLVIYLKSFFKQTKSMVDVDNKEIQTSIYTQLDECVNMNTRQFLQTIANSDDMLDLNNPFEMDFNNIEEVQGTEIENMFMKLSIGKTMLDSSMFPLIPQNAKLELLKLDEYENGDIVSVSLKDDKSIVRTYVEAGKNIVLIPANNEFETLTINKKDVKILGRVKSYTVEL